MHPQYKNLIPFYSMLTSIQQLTTKPNIIKWG